MQHLSCCTYWGVAAAALFITMSYAPNVIPLELICPLSVETELQVCRDPNILSI